ncbi:MAG: diacylglycerol kinase family lipid kinase [Clostridia bacterium]|nr:diacylglycerol kinase family lipid kinase [Clostridia bacterium]
MRYLFFINPVAGKGKGQEKIAESIKNYFKENGGDYRIIVTEHKGHAQKLAKIEAETGEQITMFACGGEGTVFEVLNGVVGYDNVTLGVLPCGSANDFLKYFGESKSFLKIDSQMNGGSVEMDIIKAGDYYCLNGCSVGMDAVVAREMSTFKKWPLVSGSFAYTLAIVKTFLGKLGITANISVDGEKPQKKNCLFAVVANGPYYGGGFMGAPDAVPFDSKLDFTLVDNIPKSKILKFIGLYKKGLHKILDCCHIKNCGSMDFTADKPIPVNLDGEIIETAKMHFEIIKKGIKFNLPKEVFNKVLIKV